MSKPTKDLIGKTYGRLTVIACAGRVSGNRMAWVCRCVCGKEIVCRQNNLICSGVRSCGCLVVDCNVQLRQTHGHNKKHSRTRTHKIWSGIISRCENEKFPAFPDYGGRGIKICSAWRQSFQLFLNDMGECPPGMTIERIDNNKGYDPGNCKWATRKEQANNTRKNVSVTLNGVTRTIAQWADHLHVPYERIWQRLYKYGWSVERTLS